VKLEKSDSCCWNEFAVESLQRKPKLATDMLSVRKSVDWDTMQFFRTEAGMRKKKKNITFKRKNIFIRFFGREEEDVPILWGEETIDVNLFRYFWL
jgi:hypothetical protein